MEDSEDENPLNASEYSTNLTTESSSHEDETID